MRKLAQLDRLIHSQRVALGREVLLKRRIYLDTKYWVLLRDVELGRTADPVLVRLHDVLSRAVAAEEAVCPIEATCFIELHKQTDPATRRATASLMDRLSTRVCLVPPNHRAFLEILRFLRKYGKLSLETYAPRELVWTRVGNIFGDMVPTLAGLDDDTNTDLQRLWAKYLWDRSLVELLEVAGFDREWPVADNDLLVTTLNEGKKANSHEVRSFQQALRNEIRGACDAYRDIISAALFQLFETETSTLPDREKIDNSESVRMFTNLVVEALTRNRIGSDLPCIDIPSRIHAAIRWDEQRKYRATDWNDFQHAAAALPYCDVFVTERSLAALLSDRLDLGIRYNVRIVSRAADALAVLQQPSN